MLGKHAFNKKPRTNFHKAESFSIDDEIWDELIDQWKHEKQYVKYTGKLILW